MNSCNVLTGVVIFTFFSVRQAPVGQGFLTHAVYRSHTTTHNSR